MTVSIGFKGGVQTIPVSWTATRAEAIKAFIAEHPEHTEQVVREMNDYENRRSLPYIGQKKEVTGFERGVDPDTLDPVTQQPVAATKDADWAIYALVGREVHWREMDD